MSRTRFDPFQERVRRLAHTHHVLGSRVRFESESAELLGLADEAFGRLPRNGTAQAAPSFMIRLVPVAGDARGTRDSGRALTLAAGASWLCGSVGEAAFAVMSPGERSALVGIPPRLLRQRYHGRYELVEFAALTLLARARALVPLHAAAVVSDGQCVLLLGDSGAGKSTFCLHAMYAGMQLLSEDSVFVSRDARFAAGVPGFLHLRSDATRWLRGAPRDPPAGGASFIRRRSGVRKLEIDLRGAPWPLAASPARLGAVVVLEAKPAGRAPLIRPLQRRLLLTALDSSQPYAASRPEWRDFRKAITRIPAFAMRRAAEPGAVVEALRAALAGEGT
jgi:hypothetical protein